MCCQFQHRWHVMTCLCQHALVPRTHSIICIMCVICTPRWVFNTNTCPWSFVNAKRSQGGHKPYSVSHLLMLSLYYTVSKLCKFSLIIQMSSLESFFFGCSCFVPSALLRKEMASQQPQTKRWDCNRISPKSFLWCCAFGMVFLHLRLEGNDEVGWVYLKVESHFT